MNSARTRPPSEARFTWREAISVFLLAWLVRGLYLAIAARNDTFGGLFLDSRLYAEAARGIRAGSSPALGEAPYLLSPLYAVFLALFPSMSGDPATNSALDVRLVQACVGAITCVLAALAADRLAGRRAAWIAGILSALYAPAIFLDGGILVASLSACLLTGALVVLISAEAATRPGARCLVAGLLLGAGAGLRPSVLLVSAALALALCARRPIRRHRVACAAALLLGTSLAIAPFSLQNRSADESFLITAGGGFNFWVGNHADASGTFEAPPGYDVLWDPVGKQIAERASGRPLSYSESSRFFFDSARADIARDPTGWARRLAYKAWLFVHPMEIPQLGASFEWQRGRVWPLRFPLDARWIFLLALLGPFLRRPGRNSPGMVHAHVLLGSYSLSVILFFVTARYRIPIMPVAIVLAAVSIDRLLAWRVERSVRRWVPVLLVLVVGIAGFRARPPVNSEGLGERHRGLSLYERGEYKKAEESLRAAFQKDNSPKTRVALALALRGLGRDEEARKELEGALTARSEDPDAAFHLGILLWETERNGGAARALFQRTLAVRPGFADAHFNLGAIELATGEMEAAERAFRTAIELAPPDTDWLSEAVRGRDLARRELSED